MIPNLNRRDALGALGLLGTAAAAASSAPTTARAGHVELGPYVKRPGVQGRMTGAAGGGGGALLRGRPLRLRHPGGPEQRVLGRAEGPDGPVPARGPRVVGQRHGRRRGAGHRRGRRLQRRPRPGADQRDDRNRRGAARQRADRRHHHRRRPGSRCPDRPGPLAAQHAAGAADRQGRVRGPPPGRDPRRDPPGLPLSPGWASPGPVAVVIPFPFYSEVWDYDCPVPLPYPLAFDEGAYRQALCLLADRRNRVGIYAGMGCLDAGPSLMAVAEMLQAPVATSVSGKGCIPDTPPAGRRLGLRQAREPAPPSGHSRTSTSSWPSGSVTARSRRPITPSPSTTRLIHVDANPDNLGRNVPADVKVCADARLFFDRLLARCAGDPAPAHARSWCKRSAPAAQLDQRENTRVADHLRRRSDDLPDPAPVRARARGADLRRRDRLDPLGVRGDRVSTARGATSRRRTTRAWAGRSPRRSAPSGSAPTGWSSRSPATAAS